MLHISRYIVVAALCVLALACGNKKDEQPKEAPESAEPAEKPAEQPAEKPATPTAQPGEQAAGEAGAPAEAASGLVPQLQKLADKACTCKDKACASAVQDEVAKLMAEAKEPPKGETQTIAETMKKLQGCIAAAQAK